MLVLCLCRTDSFIFSRSRVFFPTKRRKLAYFWEYTSFSSNWIFHPGPLPPASLTPTKKISSSEGKSWPEDVQSPPSPPSSGFGPFEKALESGDIRSLSPSFLFAFQRPLHLLAYGWDCPFFGHGKAWYDDDVDTSPPETLDLRPLVSLIWSSGIQYLILRPPPPLFLRSASVLTLLCPLAASIYI